jgi:hypothetical protein
MTATGVFALLAIGALVTSLAYAWRGWLIPLVDGSRRFAARTRAWAFLWAFQLLTFANIHHKGWIAWAITAALGTVCIYQIEHWWKRTEKARQIESMFLTRQRRWTR